MYSIKHTYLESWINIWIHEWFFKRSIIYDIHLCIPQTIRIHLQLIMIKLHINKLQKRMLLIWFVYIRFYTSRYKISPILKICMAYIHIYYMYISNIFALLFSRLTSAKAIVYASLGKLSEQTSERKVRLLMLSGPASYYLLHRSKVQDWRPNCCSSTS